MTQDIKRLLAADAVAQRFGCGLNPRLRAAIEAELRWPSKSAGPNAEPDPLDLTGNVVPLRAATSLSEPASGRSSKQKR